MIVLVCLHCHKIHQQRQCPDCQGIDHILLFDYIPPKTIHPELKNVVDKFAVLENLKDSTCAICFEDMTEGLKLPCNHLYHASCVKPWLAENPDCPMCRQSILHHKRAMPGDNGFTLKTFTVEALDELQRVERLYRKNQNHGCHKDI